MTTETHLLCESVQEITLYAWPKVYGEDNKYDLDSREVLEMFRRWGEEFESWWMSLPEEDREYKLDYLNEIEMFADKKCDEYIRLFASKTYNIRATMESYLDITVSALTREEAFDLARKIFLETSPTEWKVSTDAPIFRITSVTG